MRLKSPYYNDSSSELPNWTSGWRVHHAAMTYRDVAALISKASEGEAAFALALKLRILTASRAGEIWRMRWSEIDLDKKIWTVPANRMKADREHRMPLSPPRAVIILRQLEKLRSLLPGRAEQDLSNIAMEMVCTHEDLKATFHRFRSSFRDWAGNVSNFPREIAETALAHVIGGKAERAYRRNDALGRRKLIDSMGRLL